MVMLHANSIAGELVYNNKFESSETLTRAGTISVNCSVYCRSNDDLTRKVFRSWQTISSEVRLRQLLTWQTVQCAFSVIYSAVKQKPWCSLNYSNNDRPKKITKKSSFSRKTKSSNKSNDIKNKLIKLIIKLVIVTIQTAKSAEKLDDPTMLLLV